MRFESDHYRDGIRSASPAHDLIDDGAVRAVDAVKIADAHDRRTKVHRNIGELMKYLHERSLRRQPKSQTPTSSRHTPASRQPVKRRWSPHAPGHDRCA